MSKTVNWKASISGTTLTLIPMDNTFIFSNAFNGLTSAVLDLSNTLAMEQLSYIINNVYRLSAVWHCDLSKNVSLDTYEPVLSIGVNSQLVKFSTNL